MPWLRLWRCCSEACDSATKHPMEFWHRVLRVEGVLHCLDRLPVAEILSRTELTRH